MQFATFFFFNNIFSVFFSSFFFFFYSATLDRLNFANKFYYTYLIQIIFISHYRFLFFFYETRVSRVRFLRPESVRRDIGTAGIIIIRWFISRL